MALNAARIFWEITLRLGLQARPLGRGSLRTPIQEDGLVCLAFNQYSSAAMQKRRNN